MDQIARGAERDGLPYRLVSRLGNELHLSAVVSLCRLGCGPYDRAVLLLALLRICLPDWSWNRELQAPTALTRFGTVKGIARALDQSDQTVRRHIRALVKDGFCCKHGLGYAIDDGPENVARILAYCQEASDILLRMIEDIPERWRAKPSRSRTLHPPQARIVEVALDTYLVPFESFSQKLGDWTSMLVWSMIGTLNTRHVMLDPELNHRYAIQPTPDPLRRPISLKSVAEAIGQPYTTVWRHASRLQAAGLLARRRDGWLLTQAELHRPEIEASVHELVRYYLRRINMLISEGLDPADVHNFYSAGRPPFVLVS